MAKLFERARSFLNRKMVKVDAVTVVYRRGAQEFTILDAGWVGRVNYESVQDGAARIEWGDRDYLIPRENFPAALVQPEEGDIIIETVEGTVTTFRLMIPETGEPCWRWSDESRTRYRLHVKEYHA